MKHKWWLVGAGLTLLIVLLSPLASAAPDGLEKVAGELGFAGEAHESFLRFIPDYVMPGVGSEALARVLAGLVGTLVVLGLVWGLAKLLKARRQG